MHKLLLVLSLVATIAGLGMDYYGIYDPELSEPLFILGGGVLIPAIFTVILGRRRDVSEYWSRFAVWAIPLSIVLILITPDGGGLPPLALTKEFTTWFVGGLFALISLILIAAKSFGKK